MKEVKTSKPDYQTKRLEKGIAEAEKLLETAEILFKKPDYTDVADVADELCTAYKGLGIF